MATLGFRTVDEMIGRVDRLDVEPAVEHWKARGLDFSAILYRPPVGPEVAIRKVVEQDHGLDAVPRHDHAPADVPGRPSTGRSRWTSGCPSGT